MREHLQTIQEWAKKGKAVTLARVIKTWGSSPRPVGSSMLIDQEGKLVGSVSGGCVEGEVVKNAPAIFENQGAKLLSFGVADEEAWQVGLSCGGRIEVLLEYVDFGEKIWQTLVDNLRENRSSVLITELGAEKNVHSLIGEDGQIVGQQMGQEVLEESQKVFQQRNDLHFQYRDKGYFIQVFPRKSLLLLIGAAHITVDLVNLGKQFGFETVVMDPRGYFAQNVVFSNPPDQLLEAYPSEVLDRFPLDAYTYCAVLSHDPKIDDDALEILLKSEVGYIGALGSKKTHVKRVQRLLDSGFSTEEIERIHAPIGLAIRAKTPQEIALAIMGEIVQVKNAFV